MIKDEIKNFDVMNVCPVKIFFQDEARFGRMNDLKRCWAPPKIRPIIPKQQIREYIYTFSATCPSDGENYSIILPIVNTTAMEIFLGYFSDYYKDYKIIMVVDRASWHTSSKLKLPDNIRFIPLPAGSPELNPQENIWAHLREKFFANKSWESLDQIQDYLVEALEEMRKDKETIKSIANFSWLQNINY